MPARLKDLKRGLEQLGVTVEAPNKGSHWKCRKPGYRAYTLPAHNGVRTEIDDKYIRSLCKNLELDADELMKLSS